MIFTQKLTCQQPLPLELIFYTLPITRLPKEQVATALTKRSVSRVWHGACLSLKFETMIQGLVLPRWEKIFPNAITLILVFDGCLITVRMFSRSMIIYGLRHYQEIAECHRLINNLCHPVRTIASLIGLLTGEQWKWLCRYAWQGTVLESYVQEWRSVKKFSEVFGSWCENSDQWLTSNPAISLTTIDNRRLMVNEKFSLTIQGITN